MSCKPFGRHILIKTGLNDQTLEFLKVSFGQAATFRISLSDIYIERMDLFFLMRHFYYVKYRADTRVWNRCLDTTSIGLHTREVNVLHFL